MRVSEVRKKYPEFFVTIEAAVWDDAKEVGISQARKRISYNAAAIATLELHKTVVASRKKNRVAGKTSPNDAMVPLLRECRDYIANVAFRSKDGNVLIEKLNVVLAQQHQ